MLLITLSSVFGCVYQPKLYVIMLINRTATDKKQLKLLI